MNGFFLVPLIAGIAVITAGGIAIAVAVIKFKRGANHG